jgi:hypothetical protein
MEGRTLAWDGCANARDLGGLPLAAGGETRRRRIVRADCVAGLSPAGIAALRRHGVTRIVDLRADDERGEREHAPEGVELVRAPILPGSPADPVWPSLAALFDAAPDEASGLRDFYLACLERWPGAFAAAVAAVGGAGHGAVVIQCVAGRDRTGLVSGLLLDAAGADRDAIAADYALTPPVTGHPDATAWVMAEVLAWLGRMHGGGRGYLLAAGLAAPALDAAVGRLV